MRIAVLADTHDKIPFRLIEMISEADEIWHLGDVCSESVLDELRVPGKPLKVVRGNCDSNMDWPLTLDLQRGDCRIHLVHIPPAAPPPGATLVLHGHTHVPRHERIGKSVFLNPGSIARPKGGSPRSFAWLRIDPGDAFRWDLVRI